MDTQFGGSFVNFTFACAINQKLVNVCAVCVRSAFEDDGLQKKDAKKTKKKKEPLSKNTHANTSSTRRSSEYTCNC